jgi:CHAD domain-containing protein
MEIEAKYSVLNAATRAKLRSLEQLAGYRLAAGETLHLYDRYFDTPDQRVLAGGLALRRRLENDRTVFSLKSVGGAEGSVHYRQEMEVEPAADSPELANEEWLPKAMRDRVAKMVGDQPLSCLIIIEQKRLQRPIIDEAGATIALMALDTVEIAHPEGPPQRFFELEIELARQRAEAELEPILAALKRLPGLVPQPTSKLERGLAFASRIRPEGAANARVKADDTLGQAMSKILRPLFCRMQDHEQGSYAGVDTEELHDMRVATRRMRTAFWIAEPYIDVAALKKIRKGLAETADALGGVRDMDVFRTKTEAYLTQQGCELSAFARLFRVWDVEYIRRRNIMLAYLGSTSYARFKQRFWSALQDGLPDKKQPRRVAEVLPIVLEERLNTVLKDGSTVGRAGVSLASYHELRIDLKRLRYALEFFRDVLGPSSLEVIEALKLLQDVLGDLQDARVAVEHLHSVIDFGTWEAPEQEHALWSAVSVDESELVAPSPALEAYLHAREREIEELLVSVPEAWETFTASRVPQMVRDAVATLSSEAKDSP